MPEEIAERIAKEITEEIAEEIVKIVLLSLVPGGPRAGSSASQERSTPSFGGTLDFSGRNNQPES